MRSTRTGVLALFIVGGFFAWRNRFRIQQFLESQGIGTPLMKGNLGEVVQSGIAKAKGAVGNLGQEARSNLNENVDRKAV